MIDPELKQYLDERFRALEDATTVSANTAMRAETRAGEVYQRMYEHELRMARIERGLERLTQTVEALAETVARQAETVARQGANIDRFIEGLRSRNGGGQ